MAVTRVNQGEIVEVPFELPDGSILPHPALIRKQSLRAVLRTLIKMYTFAPNFKFGTK